MLLIDDRRFMSSERTLVSAWLQQFQDLSQRDKHLALSALVQQCTPQQASQLYLTLMPKLAQDFTKILPNELVLRIFSFLSAQELCRAAQVCKSWRAAAGDDQAWQHIWEPHIRRNPSMAKRVRFSLKEAYAKQLRTARNWKTLNFRVLHFHGHKGLIIAVEFQDFTLVTGSEDLTIRVWDIRDPQHEPLVLRGHCGAITCLALDLDDNLLVSGSEDFTMRIWNVSTGEPLHVVQAHGSSLTSVCLSDDSIIVSAGEDCVVRVWDKESRALRKELHGHTNTVNCVVAGSGLIYSGSDDGSIRVWSLLTGQCIKLFELGCQKVTCLELYDQNWMAAGKSDGGIVVLDPKMGEVKINLPISKVDGHHGSIWCLKFIQPHLLASAAQDEWVKIWGLDNKIPSGNIANMTDIVGCVQMDRGHIVSGQDDCSLLVWDFDI